MPGPSDEAVRQDLQPSRFQGRIRPGKGRPNSGAKAATLRRYARDAHPIRTRLGLRQTRPCERRRSRRDYPAHRRFPGRREARSRILRSAHSGQGAISPFEEISRLSRATRAYNAFPLAICPLGLPFPFSNSMGRLYTVSKEHIPDLPVSGGAPTEIHTPQQLAKRLQVKPSCVYGLLATQPDSLSPAVPVQRDRRSMSRRPGQNGMVEKRGGSFSFLFYRDVPGTTKRQRVRRALKATTMVAAKQEAQRLMDAEGVNNAAHLEASRGPVVTFGIAAELWKSQQ